ncbi:uncharacterized protein B0P05DRAFT_547596 [Gilbertella persicaria]|uniref:uncharacterized protein n=1 Tax=Gilbertella persicaria TaxID=101096 RepID=UPI00221E4CFF|nr:uncharacterized protein B0P05DRAFT_547596 [Gilbertella persicaria]KAI8075461.1 hypothetical protein B0P05DRAFT_547596 [Gilbertella persicaria]
MTESKKRTASPTLDKKTKVRRLAPPPSITGTKASQARAKAINAQLHNKPDGSTVKKRKTAEAPTLSSSYRMAAAGLKERPAWDLRGKVADMTQLIEMNNQKLDELRKFKQELEIAKDEKESQEKEAIQKAAQLRTELQEMERRHVSNIEDIHASQRVEYQKLEDDSLHFSRRLTTIEIEVTDARRKLENELAQLDQIRQENDILRESIERTSNQFENAESESRGLDKDIKSLENSLLQKEDEIQKKEKSTKTIDVSVEELQTKLTEAEADRERILNKIKNLEVKKKSKSR